MKNIPELQAENAKLKFLLDLAEESLIVSHEALNLILDGNAIPPIRATAAIRSVADTLHKINNHKKHTSYEK